MEPRTQKPRKGDEGMKTFQLLDCTLRDGGYYTAWDFTEDVVSNYIESMSRLPVDVVELGYINFPQEGYRGKFGYVRPSDAEFFKSKIRPDQRLALMMDEKSVTPQTSAKLIAGHSQWIDLVRIAVAPNRLPQAHTLVDSIRQQGVPVGLNIMYLSKYWHDSEVLDEIAAFEQSVASVALVDSFGSCSTKEVYAATSSLLERTSNLSVGFHGHDNLGLALANSLAAVEAGASIIDGTVLGMGRGPGNTRIEQLVIHRLAEGLDELDHEALDLAMTTFECLHEEHRWGTNLAYLVSGAAGLPQNEVMEWLGKKRYSPAAIVAALKGREEASTQVNNYPVLCPVDDKYDQVLILGGGDTVQLHLPALKESLALGKTAVIHANYRHLNIMDQLQCEQYVCLAGEVAARLPVEEQLLHATALLVPAPPRILGKLPVSNVPIVEVEAFQPAKAGEKLGPVSDIGPLALGLGAALALGTSSVTLVGFDGYSNASSSQQELAYEVQELIDSFNERFPEMHISSATQTRYKIRAESFYSRLMASL